MLIETNRVSAMVHDTQGMRCFDTELVTQSVELAIRRQLQRIAASHTKIAVVQLAAQLDFPENQMNSLLKTILPEASLQALSAGKWICNG